MNWLIWLKTEIYRSAVFKNNVRDVIVNLQLYSQSY